jgi:endonuclease/exonuclease/phosphatase family metal-dependent hydrolase
MRSYPGLLPELHLDHIYYDATLELKEFSYAPAAHGAARVRSSSAGGCFEID